MKLCRAVVVWICLLAAVLFGGTAAAVAQQPPRDMLVVATSADPQTVDPGWEMDNHAWMVFYYAYDRLMAYKGGTTGVEPQLAESYSVSPDGTVWTFKLRPGVKFADGTPLDAEAVRFTFERLKAIGAGPSEVFPTLDRVEAVDPLTVRFILTRPFGPFLSTLAHPGASIVNPRAVRARATQEDPWAKRYLAENTAGSGPFVLREWRKGERLVLEANPAYWGPKPALSRVLIRIVPESNTQRLLLERGEVDIAESLTPDQIAQIESQPGVRIERHPSFFVQYVYINNRKIADPRMRQALAYAVDYAGIIATVERGLAVQMRGPIPKGMTGHDPAAFQYTHDPQRARTLLQQAGYDGRELRLLFADRFPWWPALAQYLQANFSAAGVRVKLEQYAWATLRQKYQEGDFDLALGIWTPDFADPYMFMNFWFDSSNWGLAGNRAFYSNPKVDELVRHAAASTDQAERLRLYAEAQRTVIEESPYLYLYQKTLQIPMRARVKGYVFNPMLVDMYNFPGISKD